MAAILSLTAFHITFRVAEPAVLGMAFAPLPSANAVTRQGLGEVSAANGAGKPVLYDGQPHRACPDGKRGDSEPFYTLNGTPVLQRRPCFPIVSAARSLVPCIVLVDSVDSLLLPSSFDLLKFSLDRPLHECKYE